MDSTLLMVYGSVVVGLMGGCLWAFVAYGRAFWTTRRLTYLLLSLSWLMGPGVFTVIYLLGSRPYLAIQPNLIDRMTPFTSLMTLMSFLLVRAFNQRPSAEFREFRSPRDIMLFRPTVPPAPQQEGLFVPEARPRRPRPAAILALTIGMLGGLWALLALIGWLIRWLV